MISLGALFVLKNDFVPLFNLFISSFLLHIYHLSSSSLLFDYTYTISRHIRCHRCTSHSIHMHRSSSNLPSTTHRTPDCFFQVLVPTYACVVVLGIPVLFWSIVCELRQRVTKTFCAVGGLYVAIGIALQARGLHYFVKFYGRLALLSPCHTLLTLLMIYVARKRWLILRAIIQRKKQ